MGKRKSAKKPAPKTKKENLDTVFQCPFCSHLGCQVEINRAKKLGTISCTVCQEDFQTRAHSLMVPIDVYNDWIDACEEANKNDQ